MATGVFDILHLGHLHFLERALALGDELVVVVAHDDTVRKLKHEPITPAEMRCELIASLKPVTKAVVGDPNDHFKVVEELRPDIVVLGFDQESDPDTIVSKAAERGLTIKVERLGKYDADLDGTRKIISRIIDWWTYQKMIDDVEGGGE